MKTQVVIGDLNAKRNPVTASTPYCPEANPVRTDEDKAAFALLKRAGNGDHEAFNQLVTKYHGLMVTSAQRSTGNWSDAEDAAQNAWVSLWRACRRLAHDTDHTGAIGLIMTAGRLHGRSLVTIRNAKKRGGWDKSALVGDIQRELYGVREFGRNHATRYYEGRDCEIEDVQTKMNGLVRHTYGLPAGSVELLNDFFFQGRSMTDIAKERGRKLDTVRRGITDAVQILRHLAFRDPELRECYA